MNRGLGAEPGLAHCSALKSADRQPCRACLASRKSQSVCENPHEALPCTPHSSKGLTIVIKAAKAAAATDGAAAHARAAVAGGRHTRVAVAGASAAGAHGPPPRPLLLPVVCGVVAVARGGAGRLPALVLGARGRLIAAGRRQRAHAAVTRRAARGLRRLHSWEGGASDTLLSQAGAEGYWPAGPPCTASPPLADSPPAVPPSGLYPSPFHLPTNTCSHPTHPPTLLTRRAPRSTR